MKTPNENLILPMENQPAKPQYIHEQHNHNCQQFFGNVTGCVFAMPGAVVNQYPNGTLQTSSSSKCGDTEKTQPATRNPQLIIDYVMKLHSMYVSEGWKDRYRSLWENILELPVVAGKIYDKGKQQNTTFNRNLVANILHLMAEKKVLVTDNATKLAMALENDANASVRAKLGEMPETKIKTEVETLLKK